MFSVGRTARVSTQTLLGLLAALVVLCFVRSASADPRTSFLAKQLKNDDDYRVRTQAALALGASGDSAAVKPLCGGLDDSNVAVQVAAAAALGKLGKKAGLSCLKAAESKKSPSVRKQIKKSIAKISGGGGGSGVAAPPAPKSSDKYYVAIEVSNKTSRPTAEIERVVRGAMQKKLLATSGYAVAPAGESVATGKQITKSKGLTGYYLIATVQPAKYSGGNLTQVVRVSMWTYPGKALKGEFSPKLTQSGTPSKDTASENLLMKMCVEHAIGNFTKVVASL